MTDREKLIEAMARAAYENAGYAYEGRAISSRGPYGVWALTVAQAAAALTALEATHVVVPTAEAIGPYYERQIEWSRRTFGPEKRTLGVLDHIRKELGEIAQTPDDLTEWADVIILAMDGFWRHGGTVASLMEILLAKQKKNFARQWPDWRTMSADKAIEHDRSQDKAMIGAAHD